MPESPEKRQLPPTVLQMIVQSGGILSAAAMYMMRRMTMSKCKKKTTAFRENPSAICGETGTVVTLADCVTVIVCDTHQVELVHDAVDGVRALRRKRAALTAVMCGYASEDIQMSDVSDACDGVESAEDDLREYVETWMSHTAAEMKEPPK
jgi:hypothetical protein